MINFLLKSKHRISSTKRSVSRSTSGFTRLVEDGVTPKDFRVFFSKIFNLPIDLLFRYMQKGRKKSTPSFTTGFTLIETFVAILILTLAITGPMSIAQKGLQSSILAKDKTTAAYLAQDAIEFIRSIRDSNFYVGASGGGGGNWFDNLSGKCENPADYCIVDTTLSSLDPNAVINCGGIYNCLPLNIDKIGGSYRYGYDASWDVTKFTRRVRVIRQPVYADETDPDALIDQVPEALVDVWVSWRTGIIDRDYYLRTTIMNMKGSF